LQSTGHSTRAAHPRILDEQRTVSRALRHRLKQERADRGPIAAAVCATVLIIVVGLASFVASHVQGRLGTAAAQPAPTIRPHPGPSAARMNTPVVDGTFELEATGLRCGLSPAELDQERIVATGSYCLVSLRIRNIGDIGTFFDAVSQTAIDTAGRRIAVDGSATVSANEPKAAFSSAIEPGGQTSGWLAFHVAKNRSLRWVVLRQAAGGHGVKVTLISPRT
jgi:hypothetical protein